MEYTVTKLEEARADVHLTFNAQDIENAFNKAYQKAAAKVKINGFRPGKVPLEIVKKTLGESVTEDAIAILLNDTLTDLYPKFDFKPYNQPKINIEKFEKKETLIAKATFEVWPEVKLGNYKNVPVKTYELEISDEDVSENLRYIQYELSKKQAKEADEVAEKGDYIEFSLNTFDTTGKLVNENPNGQLYLGRNEMLDAFESNFYGLKMGEEKEFEYTIPSEAGAGQKTYKYQVEIREIFRVNLPELNDELAEEWGEEKTLEGLKSKMKDNLKKNSEDKLRELYFDRILNQIIQDSAYTLPESMVEDEINSRFHRMTHENGLGHISMEEYAKLTKVEITEVKTSLRRRAENAIKGYLTLFEIAKAESIEVGQEDLQQGIMNYAQRVGQEKMKKTDVNSLAKSIHDNMLFDKVFDFLLENSAKQIEKGVNVNRVNSILNEKE